MRSRHLIYNTWWRHQMETFSALLAICAGNSPVPGEFPTQRPVTRSFNVFFDKRLSKQSWGWWFETLPCTLWRHCNDKSYCRSVTVDTQSANLRLRENSLWWNRRPVLMIFVVINWQWSKWLREGAHNKFNQSINQSIYFNISQSIIELFSQSGNHRKSISLYHPISIDHISFIPIAPLHMTRQETGMAPCPQPATSCPGTGGGSVLCFMMTSWYGNTFHILALVVGIYR